MFWIHRLTSVRSRAVERTKPPNSRDQLAATWKGLASRFLMRWYIWSSWMWESNFEVWVGGGWAGLKNDWWVFGPCHRIRIIAFSFSFSWLFAISLAREATFALINRLHSFLLGSLDISPAPSSCRVLSRLSSKDQITLGQLYFGLPRAEAAIRRALYHSLPVEFEHKRFQRTMLPKTLIDPQGDVLVPPGK